MLQTIVKPQRLIDDWLYDLTGGAVQSGPFKGMGLLRDTAWKDIALSPMLLGCWEQELHEDLEIEIARLSKLFEPKIVNIGCAEGYYAVGLAQRLPQAKVWGADIEEECCKVTAANAEANGVRVLLGEDVSDLFSAPDLIVMDCEGHELGYLDPVRFPGLVNATIIVEIHNLPGQKPCTSEIINDRFMDTHTVKNIFEGARNPNDFVFLRDTPSEVRWMCVSENRPCFMNFFVMRPRGSNETETA